jgi:transcription termination/antitermination protein NusG
MEMSMQEHTVQERASWYAVSTRSRQEKLATLTLKSLGIRNFLPLVEEERRWSDRRKVVEIPLFPGYLFVQIPRTVEAQLTVRKVPGIVNFVGSQNGPLAVPESELDSVRAVLSRGSGCSTCPFIQAGDRVRVVAGALVGIEGTFLRHGAQSKLIISVEMIQRSVSVNVAASDVESLSHVAAGQMQSFSAVLPAGAHR